MAPAVLYPSVSIASVTLARRWTPCRPATQPSRARPSPRPPSSPGTSRQVAPADRRGQRLPARHEHRDADLRWSRCPRRPDQPAVPARPRRPRRCSLAGNARGRRPGRRCATMTCVTDLQPDWRQRKKAATRDRIRGSALRLFPHQPGLRNPRQLPGQLTAPGPGKGPGPAAQGRGHRPRTRRWPPSAIQLLPRPRSATSCAAGSRSLPTAVSQPCPGSPGSAGPTPARSYATPKAFRQALRPAGRRSGVPLGQQVLPARWVGGSAVERSAWTHLVQEVAENSEVDVDI